MGEHPPRPNSALGEFGAAASARFILEELDGLVETSQIDSLLHALSVWAPGLELRRERLVDQLQLERLVIPPSDPKTKPLIREEDFAPHHLEREISDLDALLARVREALGPGGENQT